MSLSLQILVVEDHRDIAANIADYLAVRGHRALVAPDGASGLRLASCGNPDAIVLDIMLPDAEGYELCSRLREQTGRDTPVLMLTARDTLADKLEGFHAGADDYMTKPFSLEELTVRLVALARRAAPERGAVLRVGDLELDRGRRLASRAGRPLDLTPASLKLLAALMEASPNLVPKGRLERLLWGGEVRASDALRSQMYLLRQAIDRPFDRPLLRTVHGAGYRLVDDA